jgi:spermidine synthase
MTQPSPTPPASLPADRWVLPIVLVLFAGSGCAALIYEIVWFQLLQLVIGSSAISLAVLLATFMGGMCLGSLALPRLISAQQNPFRVYALLELGLGLLGIAVLFGMPLVDRLYAALAWHGTAGLLLRGVVCAMCLLPPTLLMGATLPAMARWVETTPRGVSWLGLFYGGNIAGAVLGCLLAGFYLLRLYDMETASYAAAAVNGTVALLAVGLAALTPHHPPTESPTHVPPPPRPAGPLNRVPGNFTEGPRQPVDGVSAKRATAVYLAIGLSGACALGAEVVWTRLLSLLLGATVYTFAIILAVFLVGLGIGSSAGAALARRSARPVLVLGWCQLLAAAALAWTATMLTQSLPYWPIQPALSSSPWFTFQLDLVRCLWAILPATVVWGASFPLALAALAKPGMDPGRLVGGVYAANTVGAIAGALLCSLGLIPWVGTQETQRVLIGLSALAGLLLLWPAPAGPAERTGTVWLRFAGPGVLAAALGLVALLGWSVAPVPWKLVAFGRLTAVFLPVSEQISPLYVGEGLNASVAVTELKNGELTFHVSGRAEASTTLRDMRMQRMLGHVPALLHSRPRSVLVVGCGAGITAGSFLLYPDVQRIVICDIESLVPKVVAPYFARENFGVVNNPRVEIVHDDARHYLLTTQDQFDIITSDPIHPCIKGSATLYTQEYFELCERHLNPGGVITQWVPLFESNENVVKSELATFFEVFPHGTVWGNPSAGQGYDVILLGQVSAEEAAAGDRRSAPLRINLDELQARLEGADHALVARSLHEVRFPSALNLLATYAGQASDLRSWLMGTEINRDRNLRLQYLAGLGLNTNESSLIYQHLLSQFRFPEEIFAGSEQRIQSLRHMLFVGPEAN